MDNLNSLLKKRVSNLVLTLLDTQLDGICHQLKSSEEINGNGIQISISSDQIQEIVHELKKQIKSECRIEKRQKVAVEEGEMDIESQLSTDLMAELKRKVVENSLILKYILSKLRTNDVLNCRLVCSSWDEIATTVLIKRKNKLIFRNEWDHEESKWDIYRFENSTWRTLDMLTMLLRSSKRFPSLNFEFVWGDFKSQDIQRFFNVPFSNSITSLGITPNFISDSEDSDIEVEGSEVNLRDIGKILVEKVPNLEDLNIYLPGTSTWSGYETSFFPPEEENEKGAESSKCVLANLKNLNIIHSSHWEFEKVIMRTKELLTPKLERFDGFCMGHGLQLFIAMKKENLIKSIVFTPSDNLDLWSKFLSLNLQLEQIHIYTPLMYNKPELWKKAARILSHLLKQNKDSLTHLRINGTLSFLPGLNFPVFKNLEHLYLDPEIQCRVPLPQLSSIFPLQQNLAENFPRVWWFEFNVEDDDSSYFRQQNPQWSNILGFQGTFPSVTNLRICVTLDYETTIPLSWCHELGVMFPNTKDLKLHTLSDFPLIAPILWRNFNKVKCLSLSFIANLPEKFYPVLDCGFSGLSISQHEEIEEKGEMEFTPKLSENLSILELKDLEELHITLDWCDVPGELSKNKIMSTVAAQTFKILSQLKKIKVVVDDRHLDEPAAKKILDSLEALKDYGIEIVSMKFT